MKNLNNISTDNLISWFDEIVDNKTDLAAKEALLRIRTNVAERYDHYLQHFSSINLINIQASPYPKNHKHLLSCYKSEGSKLSELKKIIKDEQLDELKGTCQYCCVGKPKSIDHYLPISDYPEFSVLAINLIPCCKDCNEKKKSYWNEQGNRGILNFYLDNIPNTQFLFANVQFTSGIPRIEYQIENVGNLVNVQLFDIIEKHYKRLELRHLYTTESADELDEMIRLFRNYLENKTKEQLQLDLFRDGKQLQDQFGINYWRAAMRLALSSSDEFLNYILDAINIEV